MPATKIKKTYENQTLTRAFTISFVCRVLHSLGIIDDKIIFQIKRREKTQRELLQKQYGKNSITPITPVDVISSMNFRIASGTLTEEVVMKALASYWKLPFLKIEMSKLKISGLTSKLSEPFARKHLIIPVLVSKSMLLVALINPMDIEALEVIGKTTKLKVRPVISTKSDILRAIEKCYAVKKSQDATQKNRNNFRSFIKAAAKELPGNSLTKGELLLKNDKSGEYEEKYIVNAVNLLLHYAFDHRASDIHIEPKRTHSVIRLRIDGFLQEFERIPQEVHNNFVVRLKALAGMHIAEKRKPLDGSFHARFHDKDIEFRISTMPVAFGEKVMLRVLDPTMLLQQVDALGFSKNELMKYKSLISHNSGMVLVTGPTGSGKTTTLYSTLNTLADQEINITTIEDPVELVHEKFNQITVQPNVGLTFGTAIRHIVRQSSDVIMVGEIRDQETVENTFKAALSGHLVLSTLHTNDAPSAIVRLADIGAQPSLMESALIAVISQRLVRKICPLCGEPYHLSQKELEALHLSEEELAGLPIRKGFGCSQCRGTGYLGRTAVFEIMPITDELRTLIHNNAAAHIIRSVAIKEGMQTLLASAIAKLKDGVTTSKEVLRIIGGVL